MPAPVEAARDFAQKFPDGLRLKLYLAVFCIGAVGKAVGWLTDVEVDAALEATFELLSIGSAGLAAANVHRG